MIRTHAMMLAGLVVVLSRLGGIVSAAEGPAGGNPLLDELIKRGVSISNEEVLRLPAQTLGDGLSAAEQRQRIGAIPEARYDWDALTRRSAVAPFVLKIGANDGPSTAIGRQIDLWFVVYSNLDSLDSDDFLQTQFRSASNDGEAENRPRVKVLSDADLTRRGIALQKHSPAAYYVGGEFTFLDKVRVSGTTRSIKTRSPDSVVVASVLDAGFAADPEFPNGWQSVTRSDAGKRQLGALHPYAGFASYIKATRLVEPVGAVFIEYHAAFAEPREWFNGANLLRSKLPIVAQEAVRKLRRSLEPKKS